LFAVAPQYIPQNTVVDSAILDLQDGYKGEPWINSFLRYPTVAFPTHPIDGNDLAFAMTTLL
jgi:hypothetical protein